MRVDQLKEIDAIIKMLSEKKWRVQHEREAYEKRLQDRINALLEEKRHLLEETTQAPTVEK